MDSKPLCVTSINIDGIKSNACYVAHLLQLHQIVCIQEHWLFQFEAHMIYSLFPSCDGAIKCIDDRDPVPLRLRPKGNAGVATLWNKKYSKAIAILPDGSDRVLAVRVETNPYPIVIINTYMPASGTLSGITYEEILDEVFEIICKYVSQNIVLWIGDMNASVNRLKPNKNDLLFKCFCKENDLHIIPLVPNIPTYYHFSGSASSQIDHAVIQPSHTSLIKSASVDQRNPLNVGPHDAISVITTLQLAKNTLQQQTRKPTTTAKTNWQKVDIPRYRELTDRRLGALKGTITPTTHTEVIITRINSILIQCSSECQPPVGKGRKHTSFVWSSELKPLVKESKRAFWEWKQADQQKEWDCPKFTAMKLAKLHLRQAQRQIAARQRVVAYEEIMAAKETDMHLFHRLVNRQRTNPYSSSSSIAFPSHISGDTEVAKWRDYFRILATPKDLPEFDKEHKSAMSFRRQLIRSLPCEGPPPQITELQTKKHISALKNNKASDSFGITSEHLKCASPHIISLLTNITTRAFCEKKLPDDLKLGIATPIPKKERTQTDPDKFRRITITSLLGKVVEKHMVMLSDPILSASQSLLQFGFTKEVPCSTAAMLLTESIAHQKDTKSALYLTYMDASKAFDTVDHDSILNHLYNQGISGELWHLYDNLYSDISSFIKWQGLRSDQFEEGQGIRQGGLSSTGMFKARANPSLHRLEVHPDSLRIGTIPLGALMVADDLVVSSTSVQGIQSLINEAELDASRERFSFSKTKTKAMGIPPQKGSSMDFSVQLYNTKLATSDAEAHLGIVRASDRSNTETIGNRITTARRTCYSLMGAGLHGLNGVGPEVGRHLLSIYVLPRLTYGLEALILVKPDLVALEEYYRTSLRIMQHLPKSTAMPALYLLMGVPPIEALVHIRTITFFTNILRRTGSIERNLVERQLVMKEESAHSWVWYVQGLLKRYHLPSAFSLLENQPDKEGWKRVVKAAVLSDWEEDLKKEAKRKSTLALVNLNACSLTSTHLVWRLGAADHLSVLKASTKAKLLVQRYPLFYSRTAGVNYGHLCPLCKSDPETLSHFLMDCPVLSHVRRPHMENLRKQTSAAGIEIPPDLESMVKYVLDPTHFAPAQYTEVLEHITRDLCFALHNMRSTTLGYPSRYKHSKERNLLL